LASQAAPSGFWRRAAAFAVDCAILSALGETAGFFLSPLHVRLGAWGPAIGGVGALLYFGLFNSALGGGQTPGKRLAGIKVVDAEGRSIGVARSALRLAIMAIALSWILLPASQPPWNGAAAHWLGRLSLGLAGLTACLLILNRRTRRAPHDLAAGTRVVRADGKDFPTDRADRNG
jgi:uncharacterized RDD family membrane protein YckC